MAENPGISSSLHNSDIDNTQISGNYQYDEIGNLIEDVSENIDAITWNVYGKIASIDKSGTGNSDLEFAYDPAGNRILKKVTTSTGIVTKTWYIRDAQGNIMATYQQTEEIYSWQSAHIYGSSRLGVYNANITLVENDVPVEPEAQTTLQFTRGLKHYEITNHLGNVLSVITDKKIAQVVTYSGTNYKVFDPDVVSFTDYYPFGSPMVGRGWEAGNTGKYRFGFNGQEKENEISNVDGGHLVFEYRIHDVRLGRFMSVDPLEVEYPWNSPYAFAENCVISGIDLEGAEYWLRLFMVSKSPIIATGETVVKLTIRTVRTGMKRVTWSKELSKSENVRRLIKGGKDNHAEVEKIAKTEGQFDKFNEAIGRGCKLRPDATQNLEPGAKWAKIMECKSATRTGLKNGMKQGLKYFEEAQKVYPDIKNWEVEIWLYKPIVIPVSITKNVPIGDYTYNVTISKEYSIYAITYNVKAGDCLYNIAKEHGLTLDGLMSQNGITDSKQVILPGQKLNVGTYTIEKDIITRELTEESKQEIKEQWEFEEWMKQFEPPPEG